MAVKLTPEAQAKILAQLSVALAEMDSIVSEQNVQAMRPDEEVTLLNLSVAAQDLLDRQCAIHALVEILKTQERPYFSRQFIGNILDEQYMVSYLLASRITRNLRKLEAALTHQGTGTPAQQLQTMKDIVRDGLSASISFEELKTTRRLLRSKL